MSHEPDYILLDRYLRSECAPEERAAVERRTLADRSQASALEWLHDLKDTAERLAAPMDADALWQTMERRIADAEGPARRAAPRFGGLQVERSSKRAILLGLAAAVTLCAGAAALWRTLDRRVPLPESVTTRSFTTHAGERASFNLPDGSRVTLAASSVLDVPSAYGARSRDVFLQGQAFFEVVPNHDRPFRVHSWAAVTEVLGTKFSVRAYREDTAVAVLVAEGRVSIAGANGGGRMAVLAPGDLGRMSAVNQLEVEHGVDVGRNLAWVHGRLEFLNAPLGSVLVEVSRWYDLEFKLADARLAQRPFTATLGTESASDMLRLLAASLDLQVERDGRTVTLRPR